MAARGPEQRWRQRPDRETGETKRLSHIHQPEITMFFLPPTRIFLARRSSRREEALTSRALDCQAELEPPHVGCYRLSALRSAWRIFGLVLLIFYTVNVGRAE